MSQLAAYLAYGDTTTHRDTPDQAHRPRKGRLARGPQQDRPAACPAGDDTPTQTGIDTTRTSGAVMIYLPPLRTGWTELGAARARQLGHQFCTHPACFPN